MTIRMTLAALLAASLAIAGCSSTTSGGGTSTTTDTATGEDTSALNDTASGDTASGNDTTSGDTTKDAGKDTVKADIGTPSATWGECAIDDQTCIQSCVQTNCLDAYQGCQADKDCKKFWDCQVGCQNTPIQLPEQATPIAQLPNESTSTYCSRVCQTQATGPALAIEQQFETCAIGFCLDCSKSSAAGLSKAQCQQQCGAVNFCAEAAAGCIGDADCLSTLGCIFKCDNGDQTCQTACIQGASAGAQAALQTYNSCLQTNATKCVAP